jgi:flavodoxin
MISENRQAEPISQGSEKPMKILVVYYSRNGKTMKVAEDLVKTLGCDVERVIDTKKRTGPLGFLSAGKDAGKGSLTMIEESKHDPSGYDLLIIGTPVWNNTVSTPIRTYLSMHKDKIAKAAFFLTQQRKESEAFGDMQKVLGKPPVATLQLIRIQSLDRTEYQEKIGNFVSLLSRTGQCE